MKRIHYYVACSIDGFIENQKGDTQAFSGRDTAPFDFSATLSAYDVLLMGRKTFDYSRSLGHDTDPGKKNYVFSKTLQKSPDKNVDIISNNMIDFVKALKKNEGKDIWIVGGAAIASQLFAENLVDDIILKVNPVLFGAGLSLFNDVIKQTELELLDSSAYPGSYLVNHYRVPK